MGNGAKAQQKRERNAADAKKGPTSQLKAVRRHPSACLAQAGVSIYSHCH